MNTTTRNTTDTQHVEVEGTSYAYRRYGSSDNVPLLLLMHFRGTMAHWDPVFLGELTKTRSLLVVDNAGVGESSGEIPDNIEEMAEHVLTFLAALGLQRIDLLGFSMGGYVAQIIALRRPDLVGRLILAGTGPGSGLHKADPRVKEVAGASNLGREHMSFLFFPENKVGMAAGKAYWDRLGELPGGRAPMVSGIGIMRQATALGKWNAPDGGSFNQLKELKHPVLVANGNDDVMLSTQSSIRMAKALPNSQLIVFPNSGHGFLFQYPRLFANYVDLFLVSNEL